MQRKKHLFEFRRGRHKPTSLEERAPFNVNLEIYVLGGEFNEKIKRDEYFAKGEFPAGISDVEWRLKIDIKIEKLYEITVVSYHHHSEEY